MSWSLRQVRNRLNQVASDAKLRDTDQMVTAVRVMVGGAWLEIDHINYNEYVDSDFTSRVVVIHTKES